MNSRKTLLAVLLLIFAFAFPAYALQNTDSAADFLIGFGVLSEKDRVESDTVMTRADFVKLAANIAVSYDYDYSDAEPEFADVQKDSPIFNSVMLLSDLDVIHGVSAIEFAPDKNISYLDACAVLVRILGYDFLAADNGYLALANQIGILDGVNSQDNTLTAESAYRMIRNALFAEVKYGNKIDGFPTDFYGAPLMEKRFGIKEITGIVTDDGITGLTQDSTVGKGNIKIGTQAFVNQSGQNDLLGCNVRAYWKETDYENIIIYAYAPSAKNDIVVINGEDIKSFDNSAYNVLVSKETTRTKKYSLTSDYKLIYNGKPLVGGVDPNLMNRLMCPENGTVKLIDNNADSRYELAVIENYYTIVVKGYQETTKTVYNALDVPVPQNLLDPKQSISFESIEYVEVVNTAGIEMSLDAIAKNNVLSVMLSADNSYARVIISTKTASGNYTASEDDGKYITIGEAVYETGSDIREYMSFPSIGGAVTVYIRHDDKAAYVQSGSTIDGTLAYLHRIYYDVNTETVGVNMFTVDKEVKKVNFAKNIVIDGERYKTAENAYNYILNNPYAVNGLVIVHFNEADEVSRMDTAYYADGESGYTAPGANENEKSLHVMKDKYQVSGSAISWIASAGYVDEYTKIFVIPCELKESISKMDQIDISKIDIEDITVVNSWSAAVVDSTVLHTRYTIDDDSMYTDAMLVYKNTTSKDMYNSNDATRSVNYIVTDVSQAVNENNEICYQIWYTNGTSPLRIYTETTNGIKCMKNGTTVQVGDIIKFATNKSGRIPDNQLVIMYSPKTDPDNLIFENGSFADLKYNSAGIGQWEYVLLKGQVDVINDRIARIIRTEYTNGVPTQVPVILQRAKMQYVVYEDGKVDFADGSYIETIKDVGESAGEVIFDWTEGNINFAYIVR